MRIYAVSQGLYGMRIVKNLREHGPIQWVIVEHLMPRALPLVIDDPEEFVPADPPESELVLSLGEMPAVAELLPAIARKTRAKAVIAPIDNTAWLPPGLKGQIQQELAEIGVASVFPKPFCSLTESTAGYRRSAEGYKNKYIREFASFFGRPRFDITIDPDQGTVAAAEALRDSPCGSARFVATKLAGVRLEEAVEKAGLAHCHYPCLASMQKEWIDDQLYDTIMHASGYMFKEEVEAKLKEYARQPAYFQPEGKPS